MSSQWKWWAQTKANAVKRYRQEIDFTRYAHQILVGTRSSAFREKFREAFKPMGKQPAVYNYSTFEEWLERWFRQETEKEIQRDRFNILRGKREDASKGKNKKNRQPSKTPKGLKLTDESLAKLKEELFPHVKKNFWEEATAFQIVR